MSYGKLSSRNAVIDNPFFFPTSFAQLQLNNIIFLTTGSICWNEYHESY